MRNSSLLLAIVFLCAFFIGCESPTTKNPVIATIKNLTGTVSYYPANSENSAKLQTNDIQRPLFALDKLVVEADSFLQLHFPGHGDVFVESDSTVILQKPNTSSKFSVFAQVSEGVINCFIEKKDAGFAIQTPLAVAGVLGTSFQISVKNNKTDISLLEAEKGLEIQNLVQNLTTPLVLKCIQSEAGGQICQQITLTQEATESSDAMMLPQPIHNVAGYTFPLIENNKVERVPYINYGNRVKTYDK